MYIIHMFEEGGTQTGVSGQVLIALLIFFLAFFLMVVLGAWVAGKGLLTQEEEPRPAAPVHVASVHADSASDDLTILEGIGPKVARLLRGQGITSFEALAAADPLKLKNVLSAAGYQYMDPASWIEQAALAAKGNQADLKKLQGSLKGGRKIA